jgi:oligoendopeptidase F
MPSPKVRKRISTERFSVEYRRNIVPESQYIQERWRLTDLFPAFESPEIEEAVKQVEQQVQAFELIRSQLTPDFDPAEFEKVLQSYERLVRALSKLLAFSSLNFAADTQDQQAQTYMARFRQLAAEADNQTLFFKLWWKELEDDPATHLLSTSGDYRYWLEVVRQERPYTLSEPEERIINLKDVNGPQALTILYSTITDRYTFKMKGNGEKKEMTRDELSVYYRDPEPELRAAAYKELFRVYEKDLPVLGQIYQYKVRDWHSEHVGLRKFASPISVRNLYNDVPDDVVQVLLDVCRANAPLFQRYFRLKAKWVGVDKLRRYDIYAPVVKSSKRYDFADAVDLVLSSFRRFEPRVADLAERVFAEHHLDSEVRKGKRGGAFCSTVTPNHTPWLLQSYNGQPDDVATLAHELGHAVHSMLAEHHTALTQQASLPLAETASTFGEMLVIDRLLAQDPNPEARRDLLFRQMDNNYATIMRQAYFALFERDAHDLILAGASVDDLSELYAQNLADQFGDSLDLSEDFGLEWIAIPHIYFSPFYVYAYSFGQLLVLSLYQQYLKEGEDFKPRYLALLSAGGSVSPAHILEQTGINIHSADFWQGGFNVLKALLRQLEEIEIP